MYTTSCSPNKSTLPSPCYVDERVPSLPTTHPAAQLQHTPLKSPGADHGAKSVVEQVYVEYCVGMCKGVLGKKKEKGMFFVRF